MIGRMFLFLAAAAAALAQLPPPQAPAPWIEPTPLRARKRGPELPPPAMARVDAAVSDLEGRPIAGLTAADFTIEADGKPQHIESCDYRKDQPLRVAVLIDDVGLSLDSLNNARVALRQFVADLRPGDEAAILRAAAGAGALDRFTSDKRALAAAIDRAQYNPAGQPAPPDAFTAGVLGVARGVLVGMSEIPGRKALLLISDRLRDPERGGQAAWSARLALPANRGSAVVYAVDMGKAPEQPFLLDQGVAEVARDTGGFLLDGGRVAEALARIAREQAGYYVLNWSVEGPSFDFLGVTPRVGRVAVRTPRRESVVHARNGAFGSNERDEVLYGNSTRDFASALESDLTSGDIPTKVTGIVTIGSSWQVNAALHVEARDITFIKGLDGYYRATLETAIALVGDSGASARLVARTVNLKLGEDAFPAYQKDGFDYTLTTDIPQPGAWQLRSLVRDTASGKLGSARHFLRADWGPGKLAISSIVLHGDAETSASGAEQVKDARESGAVRCFKAGHKFTYSYELFNLAVDAEKRSSIDVRVQIWHDGAVILDGQPYPIAFAATANPGRRSGQGMVTLRDQATPGHYLLGLTVTDKLKPGTVKQYIDFEVRP